MHTVIFGCGVELVVSVSGIGLVSVGRIELVSVVDFVIWTSFPPDEIVKNQIGLPQNLLSVHCKYIQCNFYTFYMCPTFHCTVYF